MKRQPLPTLAVAVVALAVATFVAIALAVTSGRADTFDRDVALAIHRIDHDVVDTFMFVLTTIGSGPCLYTSIGLVWLLALRRDRWPLGFILLANALAVWLVNVLLKQAFARMRPTLFDEIARPETFSFPSGHAMSAMGVFGAMAIVLIALYPQLRRRIIAAAAFLIVGVGISRVYLGVHWPLDVLAGYAAAIPALALTVVLVRRTPRAPVPPGPTPRS